MCACIPQVKQFPRDILVEHLLRAHRAGGQGALQEAQPLLTRAAKSFGSPQGVRVLPFSALPGECRRPFLVS